MAKKWKKAPNPKKAPKPQSAGPQGPSHGPSLTGEVQDKLAYYAQFYDGHKGGARLKAFGKGGYDRLKGSFGEGADGWDVAKGIGGHALRGAVGGAAIGGTMEAAQGGSFWTGAKEGAFNGAVGWAGYRTTKRAFSDNAYNPDGGWGSTVRGMGTAWAKTGKYDPASNPKVSNQVRRLAQLNQGVQTNRASNGLS